MLIETACLIVHKFRYKSLRTLCQSNASALNAPSARAHNTVGMLQDMAKRFVWIGAAGASDAQKSFGIDKTYSNSFEYAAKQWDLNPKDDWHLF